MYELNQKPYLGSIQFGPEMEGCQGGIPSAALGHMAEQSQRDKAKSDVALDELKSSIAMVNQLATTLQKRLVRVLAPQGPENKASGAVGAPICGPLTSDLYAMTAHLRSGISSLEETIRRLEV